MAVYLASAKTSIQPGKPETHFVTACVRFLGLAFVVPGVVSPQLPGTFAQPVAYGDFITASLALLALAALATLAGTTVAWAFNVFGSADLLFAFFLRTQISLPDQKAC